jgi:hypothetical protein
MEIEILEEFASDDIAARLATGPIGGRIDTREMYAMYHDFRPVLIRVTVRAKKSITAEAVSAMIAFESFLEEVIPDDPGLITDAELVKTAGCKALQKLAKTAAERLKEGA